MSGEGPQNPFHLGLHTSRPSGCSFNAQVKLRKNIEPIEEVDLLIRTSSKVNLETCGRFVTKKSFVTF